MADLNNIEIIRSTSKGYSPVSIHDGWQVAYLTDVAKHYWDDLDKIEVHNHTDELFILLKGSSVLVTADGEEKKQFQAVSMEPFIMYNIPMGVWHNIAMAPDTLMLIAEKSGTHLNDVRIVPLNADENKIVTETIMKALETADNKCL